MNKKILVKILSIVLALSFGLSSSLMYFHVTSATHPPESWPNCGWSCSANDVRVTKLWLGDCNTGVELNSCTLGQTVNTCIWGEFNNNSNHARRVVILLADLYINGVFTLPKIDKCALDSIASKATTSAKLENINWTCGNDLELKNIIVAWQTRMSSETCATVDRHCNDFPSGQCYQPGTSIHVSAPPECTVDADCDDTLYCTGQETCVSGQCVAGTAVDCSTNNKSSVNTCLNDPDNIASTFDFRNSFTSQCNENTDSCTTGDSTITHTCSVTGCSAQCDAQHSCTATDCDYQNGCVGKDYYTYTDVVNSCQGGCNCTTNQCGESVISYNDPSCTQCQDDNGCNSRDRDYCDGTIIKHDEGVCTNYECVTNTTTVQNCDNTLACDGVETCSNASCVAGTQVNCSQYNLPEINTCSYVPDFNPYSLDSRAAFTSVCQEPSGSCTSGDQTITHTCDITTCNAECVSNVDCDDLDSNTIDTCESCLCVNTPIPPNCGNGEKEGDEQCDETDLNNYTCTDLNGYTGGTLGCKEDCTFDTSQCTTNQLPTMYACNPITFQCAPSTEGQYTTSNCDGECVSPITTTTTVPPVITGGFGGQYIVPTGVVAGAATEQGQVAGASTGCNPYLLKYIKLGADNDPEEVKKLESFLNEQLGLDLPIDGIYDQRDYEAVKQFQLLLKDKVLAPWVAIGCLPNIDTPTGYVYRTTKWTINSFFCPESGPDVSDEKCEGIIIIGLGEEEGAVLGEATTTPTTTTETTPLEETGTTGTPENGVKPSYNWLWYLIGIIVIGGVVYLAYSKRKK